MLVLKNPKSTVESFNMLKKKESISIVLEMLKVKNVLINGE